MTSEWVEWHLKYEDGSPLDKRLKVVQGLVREELDRRSPGPIRIISICSGDGRDLIGAIATHYRRSDVVARLFDLDIGLAEAGRRRAQAANLTGVEFVQADAGRSEAFEGAVPADLVLACGIYGNISDSDIRNMIGHLPELCSPEALVIWTRGRFAPDLTPAIRSWFVDSGFAEVAFVTIPDSPMSVGAHRLSSPPRMYDAGVHLFRFLPPGERPAEIARGKRSAQTPASDLHRSLVLMTNCREPTLCHPGNSRRSPEMVDTISPTMPSSGWVASIRVP